MPLSYALDHKHFSVGRLLAERGADVNRANNDGYTPLHWASDDLRVARWLVERGADVNR